MQSGDPRFEIRDAGQGVGYGMFALQPIKKGDFILEYTGIRIPNPEAEDHPGRYLFELDDDWTLDGDTEDNIAKYINHACVPNCEAEVQDGHINIYATQDIAPGEELNFDYDQEYFDEFIKPVGCKCASPVHRK